MNAEILVKMGILKQIAARGKIEAISEFCKNCFDQGQKVILFGYHREVINSYVESLQSNLSITGATKVEDRQKYVDRFQNDPNEMSICLSIRAASVGLTLTASSTEVFAEFDWTSAMHDQAEARAHRIGQKDHVSAYYFKGIKTIDDDIISLIEFKRKMVNDATGTVDVSLTQTSAIKDLLKKRYNFDADETFENLIEE
jgi:SWI/SNF-related matrix-associated actin-dependent regulator 1 of chromatin subfamily A